MAEAVQASGRNRVVAFQRTSPGARWRRGSILRNGGGVLLSHPVSRAVPSALEGLTSLFGMGRGVTPPLWPPQSG